MLRISIFAGLEQIVGAPQERAHQVSANRQEKPEVQNFLLPVIYAHPSQLSLIKDEKAAALYEFNVANAFSVSGAR
jgi:hypothetical protein